MYDLVEFRHLKYIAAVAEEGNITRAADRLHIAQPSLSKQIKDIEDEIGFSIFIRTRDGVSVTPSGQIIVAYAQEAIVRRSEVVTLAKAVHRGDIPPLRLGISSFINPALLQHLRDSYHEYFPACIVHLSSGSPSHDWVVHYVARNPLVVCMRMDDPLANGHEISKDDLSTRLNIFCDPELHPAAHRQLFEMLEEAGIHPEIKCVAATPADIQWMIRAERGVALIDQSIPFDSDLTTRPIAGIHWTVDVGFVHHVQADHLALPFVVQFARQMTTRRKANQNPAQRPNKPVQLQLLA
jgi:LysR family hydrogen peroxide-inducible transcriptional activator